MSRTRLVALILPALLPALAAQDPGADRRIAVPGTDALVRLWTDAGEGHSAVSRDGGATWFEQHAPRYELSFRDFRFDPVEAGTVPPLLMAPQDHRLFYVQFVTDIIPEYRTALERLGVEVLYHFPYQSYIVRMDRADAARVAAQEYVRAVADMHVAYKLEAGVLADVMAGDVATATYDLMLADKRADAAGVEAEVRRTGELVAAANGGVLVTARLDAPALLHMASDSRVLWIEKLTPASADIDIVREWTGVNGVIGERGGQEFGRGIAGHVVEGVHTTHCDMQGTAPWSGPPIAVLVNGFGAAGTDHGTGTAGEIYASGRNAPLRRGIMPLGQLYYTEYSVAIQNTNNRYAQTADLVDPSGPYRCSIQTASWGYSPTISYTTRSAEMDDILGDFDLFVTNSQSNTGNRNSRPQAWAKDVSGIGGFNHFDNLDPSDDCWCNTGSTGPAQDGRVGVSFASFYDDILTVSGSGCSYGVLCCTSGATPTISGLAGCVVEMWTDGVFGGTGVLVDPGDVGGTRTRRFAARPHYTTTRALLTVSTYQVDMARATRFQQGWGQPNVQTLYDERTRIFAVDETDVLTQGQTAAYLLWVPPGTPELRASMNHQEDEAVPNAIPTRHNSLDLIVTDQAGQKWYGNRGGLFTNPYNVAPGFGEGIDDIDVHENVFLRNPSPGVYAVTVTASAITMDNHKETPALDVDFGLAVRGKGTSGMVLDMSSSGPGDWSVSLTGLPPTWSTGFTMLSADTGRTPGFGNLFGVQADGLSFASLVSGAGAGNLFHFTDTPGVYPHAPFTFPAGVAHAVQGLSFDAVAFVADASGNIIGMSNVDRVTIQ